jgi:hypothetical protein
MGPCQGFCFAGERLQIQEQDLRRDQKLEDALESERKMDLKEQQFETIINQLTLPAGCAMV